MALPYSFQLGSMPIIISQPVKRMQQAQALIDKYLKPKIQVEKVSLKITPEDFRKILPYLIGIGAFILFLRLIK